MENELKPIIGNLLKLNVLAYKNRYYKLRG